MLYLFSLLQCWLLQLKLYTTLLYSYSLYVGLYYVFLGTILCTDLSFDHFEYAHSDAKCHVKFPHSDHLERQIITGLGISLHIVEMHDSMLYVIILKSWHISFTRAQLEISSKHSDP